MLVNPASQHSPKQYTAYEYAFVVPCATKPKGLCFSITNHLEVDLEAPCAFTRSPASPLNHLFVENDGVCDDDFLHKRTAATKGGGMAQCARIDVGAMMGYGIGIIK